MYQLTQHIDHDIKIDINQLLITYANSGNVRIGLGGGCEGYQFTYDGYYIIVTDREGVSLPNGASDTLLGIYADTEHTELLAMVEDENELKRNLE